MARRMSLPSVKFPVWMRPRVPMAPAPPMAMMDSRRENQADCLAFMPVRRLAVMVMPLRDVPGMRANVCMRPISRALRIVSVPTFLVLGA